MHGCAICVWLSDSRRGSREIAEVPKVVKVIRLDGVGSGWDRLKIGEIVKVIIERGCGCVLRDGRTIAWTGRR